MRKPAPLRELRDGVFYVTLDTPSSSVNVLTETLARKLCEGIDSAESGGARVIVLQSGKPGSFLNGVPLMLAGSVREPSDAARLTAPARAAYDRLERTSVPTVAAIRGNCYGCGVELTLRCSYRVCADDFDTHFYMTELPEYLLVPIFGATLALPKLLGLEPATRFLIWGERWSAQSAEREGLVDARFDVTAFATRVHEFALSVADRWPARAPRAIPVPSAEFVVQTRERISKLPAMYRDTYAMGFDLMVRAARGEVVAPEAEQLAAGASAVKSGSRAARQFFFIRRLAQEVSQRGVEAPERQQVVFDGSAAAQWLKNEIENRHPAGIHLAARPSEVSGDRTPGFCFVGYAQSPPSDASDDTVWIHDCVLGQPPALASAPLVYAPFRTDGVIEIACRPERIAAARSVCQFLTRAGFTAVVSTPVGRLSIDQLVQAFCGPLIDHARRRGSAVDAARTLHEFGFLRYPGDWLSAVEGPELAALLAPYVSEAGDDLDLTAILPNESCSGGRPDPDLLDAVLLSLLTFAVSALSERSLAHASLVDLLVREVIGFPLGHCSLCRYMTIERAKSLVLRNRLAAPAVPGLEKLTEFVEKNCDFYL